MHPDNRRSFFRKSSLWVGALGIQPLLNVANGQNIKKRPVVVERKTVFLWNDKSANNGADAAKRPKLEFFIPETNGNHKRAAIIVCPGGGYGALAAHEGAPFAELFAAKGIVSAVLTYRVAPNQYPAPYADACRAVRLVRSQAESLNIDADRVGIMGFSAGGHLCSTVATQPELYKDPEDQLAGSISARPDRVILGYPVISFEEFTHKGSVSNLLGKNPEPRMLRQLSNHKQVKADSPPAFLFHTADDAAVPVQNSLMFADAYIQNKVPVALHVYPKGRHGVGLALNDKDLKHWSHVLLAWLEDWQGKV